jgi:predicted nucleotidyltransferase
MPEGAEKMKPNVEEIVSVLTSRLRTQFKDITVILFGSAARGEWKTGSDVDLCIICRQVQEKAISKAISSIVKSYNIEVQIIFTDTSFGSLDHTFVETIIREGRLLVGPWPMIALQKLRLEPYRLLRYDIHNLSNPEKMRLRRALYGTVTTKRYKGKVYTSNQTGLIDKDKSIRAGIASVLVPEKDAKRVVEFLRSNGAQVREIVVWMSAI